MGIETLAAAGAVIGAAASAIGTGATATAGAVGSAIGAGASAVGSAAGAVGGVVAEGAAATGGAIAEGISATGTAIADGASAVAEGASSAIEAVGDTVGEGAKGLEGMLTMQKGQTAPSFLQNQYSLLKSDLKTAGNELWNSEKSTMDNIKGIGEKLGKGGKESGDGNSAPQSSPIPQAMVQQGHDARPMRQQQELGRKIAPMEMRGLDEYFNEYMSTRG